MRRPARSRNAVAKRGTIERFVAERLPVRKRASESQESEFMGLILLEALLALLVLVLIVWWTMFSGRNNGELRAPGKDHDDPSR